MSVRACLGGERRGRGAKAGGGGTHDAEAYLREQACWCGEELGDTEAFGHCIRALGYALVAPQAR